jgi:hypothetical protein
MNKPRSKLAQITATSVAIPFTPESCAIMKNSGSIEVANRGGKLVLKTFNL